MRSREAASKLVYLEAGVLRTMLQLTVASAAVTSTTVELLSGVRTSRTTQNRIATMASSLPAGTRNASAPITFPQDQPGDCDQAVGKQAIM